VIWEGCIRCGHIRKVPHQWHNVCADGCGYRGDNIESIVAGVLLLLSPVAVLSMVRHRGMDGCMSPAAAVLVLWDVAICVVAIVHQNADINVSGLGVNHSGTVGDCAIAGGCAGGEGDCDSDVCGCGSTGECEAAAWVSCNTNINVCMLVNCFCAIGGCAIAGGYTGGEGDWDSDVCGSAMAPGMVRQQCR